MLKSALSCCKVYISETRNKSALESIERAAKLFPDAPIVNKFEDHTYNRVGYTLVSKSSDSSSKNAAVFSMVKAAYQSIDFDLHSGSHPRLGVVDHICFHPLASTSLDQVAITAKDLAKDVGSILQVPTYTYGAAHKEQRSLDAIRRDLGYFKPNATGHQWSGGLQSAVLPLEPDEGPTQAVKAKGVAVIGATRWVDNYNIPVFCTDIGTVRRIAKRVSGRGGGLASVQSMALVHDNNVIEVACNLLEPSVVGGEQVQGLVEQLGTEAGVSVGKGYFTDLSQDHIIQTYLKLTSS
ncbi:putative 5-formyltetrahydrofolate cyclo-ligase, Glutamate formimidoyltransferase [Helianthus annuus]|uniref:5-formyltetrahydrofolate cyclo-ligase, Glutamate formimidoyltransferase n=1 Tax=Helianthus annuus TaxID=4232 RepID=A0A9K3DFJ9_HELAN|nr:formimidoyltransferase-cyclodeaminase-like [Helianthus annuus]KAF5753353.1 putative 5-formyltetrahydrofolate cyclo-ligase, Glutamate formimidoyltransferase [Helianthus annuus]KAJ0445728.1 putative 5-formyltetrahydrofolate cyclo-ligase, Glutamate formimidoyltransferase [Helianthus annuus]KAJ0824185.1 putative 5-formyltetrahydrofolate cyclo-ligase, Glutamate formimidoyltransferase [Helianthus annuus]